MEFEFTREDRYVGVRFTGLWTIPEHSPVARRILDECEARHQDLLLVDFTAVENKKLSLAERFRLGFSALSLRKLRKVAVIGRPDLLDGERFGQLVARNSGVNVRVFTTRDAARRWLLERAPASKAD